MARAPRNPTGKNSPSSFDEFAPTKPYGSVERAQNLEKGAPVPGDSGHALGSARRATEIALKSAQRQQDAETQARAQQEPTIPAQPQQQLSDPYQSLWSAVAQDPQASSLVREYAAMA